jgi:hypothetical protein
MPKCPYCGEYPYKTFCASYYDHLRCCSKSFSSSSNENKNTVSPRTRGQGENVPHTIITNIYNIGSVTSTNISITNMYLDYPSTPLINCLLSYIEKINVKQIKTVDDLNKIVHFILDADNCFLDGCIKGIDKRAKSQAISFMADLMRRIRGRMKKEILEDPEVPMGNRVEIEEIIDGAEVYEKEFLDEKKLLGC